MEMRQEGDFTHTQRYKPSPARRNFELSLEINIYIPPRNEDGGEGMLKGTLGKTAAEEIPLLMAGGNRS